jgi:methionine-rich copper-binding protein CopC
MWNKRSLSIWVALPLILGAWTVFHIDLRDSYPKADQALDAAPQEIWLEFSVQPDTSQSTFSIRGPAGGVDLGDVSWNSDGDPTVLRAAVEGEMPPGAYIISWVAAPMNDHGGRGRINFTIVGSH